MTEDIESAHSYDYCVSRLAVTGVNHATIVTNNLLDCLNDYLDKNESNLQELHMAGFFGMKERISNVVI